MLIASLMFRQQVLLKIARFVGFELRERSTELDRTIEDACAYINEQQERLRTAIMRRDLLSIEVRHLQDELDWLNAVLKAANVNLSDYDHLRRKREDR